jgi:hypothetical protein
MLEGSLLALDVLGMLLIMFWCIKEERSKSTKPESPGASARNTTDRA